MRQAIALSLVLTLSSGCSLVLGWTQHTRPARVTEHALVAIQTALWHVCDPKAELPVVPTKCGPQSLSAGLSTQRFIQANQFIELAFDVLNTDVALVLNRWNECHALPRPVSCDGVPLPADAYRKVFKLISDAVAIARTMANTAQTKAIFDAIYAVTDALSKLGDRMARQGA